MTKATAINPAIQNVVNLAGIRLAEAQYRLARYWTPFGREPERVDFERVAVFLDDVYQAFPEASPGLVTALQRTQDSINEQRAVLQAFTTQDVAPTLTEERLFQTASANVRQPGMARYADAA